MDIEIKVKFLWLFHVLVYLEKVIIDASSSVISDNNMSLIGFYKDYRENASRVLSTGS